MKKGRAGTMTDDDKRNGTTTLFAALNVATGHVIGQCMKRHRHQEWLKFLRTIDRNTPQGLALHLIADNYATHKHAKAKVGWSGIHASTCTSPRHRRRGSTNFSVSSAASLPTAFDARFQNVAELETAIEQYLDHHNAEPKPFVSTASAAHPQKVARG